MELAFIIWAVGTLPAVSSGMCFILFFMMIISAGVASVMAFVENDPTEDDHNKLMATKTKKVTKTILFTSLPLWFFFLLIPDKETSYQMLAAYGVQTLVENETAQELASDGVDVLKALMSKAKKDLAVEK
jgi:hypothetical protein